METGIRALIESNTDFDGIPVRELHTDEVTPDLHPCIIVKCEAAPRMADLASTMNAREPAVTVCLYTDYNDTSIDAEALEFSLDCVFQDLPALQSVFNYTGVIPDDRPVTGVHVHYVDSMDSSVETSKKVRTYAVTANLIVEQVSN